MGLHPTNFFGLWPFLRRPNKAPLAFLASGDVQSTTTRRHHAGRSPMMPSVKVRRQGIGQKQRSPRRFQRGLPYSCGSEPAREEILAPEPAPREVRSCKPGAAEAVERERDGI